MKVNAITRKYRPSIYCNSRSAINYSVFIAITVIESFPGADPETNLTGFPLPTINHYEYIYGNFRVLNIREFPILGLFVKSTILNIKKKSAEFRPNWYSHWVVECHLSMGLVVFYLSHVSRLNNLIQP